MLRRSAALSAIVLGCLLAPIAVPAVAQEAIAPLEVSDRERRLDELRTRLDAIATRHEQITRDLEAAYGLLVELEQSAPPAPNTQAQITALEAQLKYLQEKLHEMLEAQQGEANGQN